MIITMQDILFDMSSTQEIDMLGKSLGDVSVEDLMAMLMKRSDAGQPADPSSTEMLNISQIDIPDEEE